MTMNKPTIKREVAVQQAVRLEGLYSAILLHASPDAAQEFSVFGEMQVWGTGYKLYVDPRYDFDEVLAYIENYG